MLQSDERGPQQVPGDTSALDPVYTPESPGLTCQCQVPSPASPRKLAWGAHGCWDFSVPGDSNARSLCWTQFHWGSQWLCSASSAANQINCKKKCFLQMDGMTFRLWSHTDAYFLVARPPCMYYYRCFHLIPVWVWKASFLFHPFTGGHLAAAWIYLLMTSR